jgi:hypothetical protein
MEHNLAITWRKFTVSTIYIGMLYIIKVLLIEIINAIYWLYLSLAMCCSVSLLPYFAWYGMLSSSNISFSLYSLHILGEVDYEALYVLECSQAGLQDQIFPTLGFSQIALKFHYDFKA